MISIRILYLGTMWCFKHLPYAFLFIMLKVVLSTLAFTSFELPPNDAVGTKILEFLFHSRPDLVSIIL